MNRNTRCRWICLGAFLGFAFLAVWPLGTQEERKFEVTAVGFAWFERRRGPGGQVFLMPSFNALVMTDHEADRLVLLPEWTLGGGGHREPAVLEREVPCTVYARFRGAGVRSARIKARTAVPGMPEVSEHAVMFAGGWSRGNLRPESPQGEYVRFQMHSLPGEIGVYDIVLIWEARDIIYEDGTVVPGPVGLGNTEHEIFTIRWNPRVTHITAGFNGINSFYKTVVRWSTENYPPIVEPDQEAILDHYLQSLKGLAGGNMRFLSPHAVPVIYTPVGETPAGALFTYREQTVDHLLDLNQGACASWAGLFVMMAGAQGIAAPALRFAEPVLVLPGANQQSELVEIPHPAGEEYLPVRLRWLRGPEWDKHAETFRTIELRGINAETKKWEFFDHNFVAFRRRRIYDPSFETQPANVAGVNPWWEYLKMILNDKAPGVEKGFAVKKPIAQKHNDWWVPGRAIWWPADADWTRRGAGQYKYQFHQVAEERPSLVMPRFVDGSLENP